MIDAMEMLKKAHKKFEKEYEKKNGKLTVAIISRELNIPYSSVYSPLFHGRKCTASTWVSLMGYFGALEICKNKVKVSV